MKKKIATIKLDIIPGKASPQPPVGPMLGQAGLNIMEFCKSFNEKTKNLSNNFDVPVKISVFKDKSFTYVIKKPKSSKLIKKVIESNNQKEPTITLKQIYEIALIKQQESSLMHLDLKSICLNLIGTIKSMQNIIIVYK